MTAYQPSTPDPEKPTRPRLPWSVRLLVLAPSCFLYLVACSAPAIDFLKNGEEPQRWYGFEAMLLGWQGAFIGQLGWYANPVLLIACVLILFRRFVAAALFGSIAVAIAGNSWQLFHQEIPADEGNVNHLQVTAFGIGFYLWFASLIAAVVAPILAAIIWRALRRTGR
jgi:hypothetical protein